MSSTLPAGAVQQGHSYRPDIDGLRAIAIISVVAFHARLAPFNGGYVGVDVFFVISGFLIGSLVYRDIRGSKFSFLRFYERRAKRILPALLTVLLVCDIIAFVLLSPLELRDYCAQAFSAAASGSNVYFWLRSNYFSPISAFKPLLMTWSLGIEEQFYLLFPITLFLLHKFARRRLFHIISVVCIVSFVCSIWSLYNYPSAAFYLLPMRAWELGLGVLIAIREVERKSPLQLGAAAANVLGWIGLGLVLFSALAYTENMSFPGFAAVLPTAGTVCLINARTSFVNRRLLASRPMVFIGLISYSWYLWHWPLMSFARIVSGGLLSVPRAVLIAVLSLVLAKFSHLFIEQPFRKSLTPTAHLLGRYATLLVLLSVAPLLGYMQKGWPSRMPELAKDEAAVREVEHNPCLAGFGESTPRLGSPCVVESTGPKLALLGDSHAAALGPAVRVLAQHHGYGFELLTKATCPPLSAVTVQSNLYPRFARACAAFNRAVFQRVVNDRRITVVILAGCWSAPLRQKSGMFYSDIAHPKLEVPELENDANLHSGLLNAIRLLREAGKRVVVAADVPSFEPDPMSSVRNVAIKRRGELAAVLTSHVFSMQAVSEQALIKPPGRIADKAIRQAAVEGGADIIDLDRNLCPSGRCHFWDDGVLFYSDSSHLTAAGAEYALRGQDPILSENPESQWHFGQESGRVAEIRSVP
jgi:peptidoglycan/LPS O-acetylase OafA/YrhL